MKFTQVFTLGLFALSTQAAAIPQESTTEVDKRLDADVAAQLALNILNLIQLGIGADVNVSAKREDTVAAQIGANILNLIQAAVGAQTTVDL